MWLLISAVCGVLSAVVFARKAHEAWLALSDERREHHETSEALACAHEELDILRSENRELRTKLGLGPYRA